MAFRNLASKYRSLPRRHADALVGPGMGEGTPRSPPRTSRCRPFPNSISDQDNPDHNNQDQAMMTVSTTCEERASKNNDTRPTRDELWRRYYSA